MDTKQTIVEGVDALTLNGKSEPETVETATDAQAQEAVGGEGTTTNADDVVDPWNVASTNDAGVDYDKLISMQYSKTRYTLYVCVGVNVILLTRCRAFWLQ